MVVHIQSSLKSILFNSGFDCLNYIVFVLDDTVWTIGGMNLRGKNGSTQRKTFPCATLSTVNTTWPGLQSSPGLHNDKPARDLVSHFSTIRSYGFNSNGLFFSVWVPCTTKLYFPLIVVIKQCYRGETTVHIDFVAPHVTCSYS